MGIFKNITKTLKKAAPIIGAGIGMYFGGPMGASIGSGIGSLAANKIDLRLNWLINQAITSVASLTTFGLFPIKI